MYIVQALVFYFTVSFAQNRRNSFLFLVLCGVQVCLSLHKSFFYCRHTGELENFNSMMTKYAPKRIAFEYVLFPV